jgi:septum formation protein
VIPGRPLLLASRSPQRRAILDQLGLAFTVIESGYAERALPGVSPAQAAVEHALGKVAGAGDGDLVLGVDTVVDVDDRLLGKPAGEAEASSMLRLLSGRTHLVHSGICLRVSGVSHTRLASTEVTFRPLLDDDVAWYVATGEWRGRAGGYAVQGKGAALVVSISGDYTNVVGLPVAALLDLLSETEQAVRC